MDDSAGTPQELGKKLLKLFTGATYYGFSPHGGPPQRGSPAWWRAVRDLISRDAALDVRDDQGQGLLFHAMKDGREELTLDLLEKGAPADGDLLYLAVDLGLEPVALALIAKGLDPDRPGRHGSALKRAIYYGQTKVALSLIEHGADVHWRNARDGRSVLMTAVEDRNLQVARRLIAKGARVGQKDLSGKTAVTLAKEIGYAEMDNLVSAAAFEQATEGFRTGLREDMPVSAPLRPKKRGRAP